MGPEISEVEEFKNVVKKERYVKIAGSHGRRWHKQYPPIVEIFG